MGVMLVTGSGSGLGLETAVVCAKAGHIVYAGLRSLESTQRVLSKTPSPRLIPVALDITKREERQAVLQRIEQDHGHLDVLVNNAGIAIGGFLEQLEEKELRQVFDVNVFGTFALTKESLPLLRKSKSPIIISVSSMLGRLALPGLGAYIASKFALEGMFETLRHELVPFGIRVVILEPGAYKTDFFVRNRVDCRNSTDPSSPPYHYFQELARQFHKVVPKVARDPNEVANLIVALVETPHPHLRYQLGFATTARSIMLRLLPFRVLEAAVSAAMKRPLASGIRKK